jgi:hypothetical protein
MLYQSSMDMNTYLERFMQSEEAEYPLVDMTAGIFVTECIDRNYSLEKVKLEVNRQNLSNSYTVSVMSDFWAREKDTIVNIIENYKGIYSFHASENDDPEENTIYAVFPDPVSAFQYTKQLLNTKQELV